MCTLSYLVALYGFAVAYAFVSRANPGAFTGKRLDLLSAVYFSVVTAATVGYGDIAPVSEAARMLVVAEILCSLIYGIFFFSVLAGGIRERRR
jgi:hypothetical protein